MRGDGGLTHTFVFTDIEGSTQRWQTAPEAMRAALAHHDGLLSAAIESQGGTVFKHTGDGICAVFDSAGAATLAGVEIQRQVGAVQWKGIDGGLAVRVGIHTGAAQRRDSDWFGPVLNRTARIMGVAHGGQILVSGVTAGLLADEQPAGVDLLDLGHHRLRDLVGSEHIHQIVADGLVHEFPDLVTLDTFTHNLPAQRTSFVGRESDIAAVEKRLDLARLVTLTGIGGAGKTRLAVEVAAQVLHRHPDGVAFVDLGPLGDGEVIPETVADAAGVLRGGATGPVGDSTEELLGFLARREMLVVLDNCEHLVDDCAHLIDEILARCPGVTVLATSREPLGVEGEHVVRVGSLPTEGGGDAGIRLFDERAVAVDQRWDLTEHRGAVVDICQRLDGLPLAIELAAAQIRYLSPDDIAARLDDRFDLLAGGRRRVQRQQTLEAVLDWSHDLLDDTEKAVLRRLSVFAGSFSLSAAEAVTSDGTLSRSGVRQAIGALVDKSLVVPVTGDGASRFRLLETVRLYGLRRLTDAEEAVVVRDRHRDHVLASLEAHSYLDLFERLDLASGLRSDLENYRASHTWSLRSGRTDLVARQTARMAGLYWQWGLADEAIEWAERSLDAESTDPDVRAEVWLARGIGAMLVGDLGALEGLFRQAVDTADDVGLQVNTRTWLALGLSAERERAVSVLDEADAIAGDDVRLRSFSELIRGSIPLFHAEPEGTIEIYGQSEHRPANGTMTKYWWVAWHTTALVLVGRADEALQTLDENREGAVAWGQYAIDIVRSLAHLHRGEREHALQWIAAARENVHRSGVPLADRDVASALAAISMHDDRPEQAARLLGAARGSGEMLALRSPASWAIFRHHRRQMFDTLGPEAGRAAYRAGRQLDLADAVAEAWIGLEH